MTPYEFRRAIQRGDWRILIIRDYYVPGGTEPFLRNGDIEILPSGIAKGFIGAGLAKRVAWKKAELLLARPGKQAEAQKARGVKSRPSHLAPGQIEGIKRLYLGGYSVRATAEKCGVTKRTAAKFYHRLRQTLGPVTCACGQPATHLGWCQWRIGQSDARQRYMQGKTQ